MRRVSRQHFKISWCGYGLTFRDKRGNEYWRTKRVRVPISPSALMSNNVNVTPLSYGYDEINNLLESIFSWLTNFTISSTTTMLTCLMSRHG